MLYTVSRSWVKRTVDGTAGPGEEEEVEVEMEKERRNLFLFPFPDGTVSQGCRSRRPDHCAATRPR